MSLALRLLYDYNTTMFEPKYTISNTLAINIRKIGEIVGELNNTAFSNTILANLEHDARVLSSFSSTQIEGNPLPLTDVKKIIKSRPDRIRDTEREVLNYNKALVLLDTKIRQNQIDKLNSEFICDIQSMVVDNLMTNKSDIGRYRIDPVFVNDPIKRKTIYLPPDAKDVPNLVSQLIDFVNTNEGKVDPLIIAGIFHKQFVVIHPFMDGNGRTTRLITKALLAKLGINTFPLFSFENYYNNNVSKYFEQVGVFGNYYEIFSKIDFSSWLEYFTDGIIDELNRILSKMPQYQNRLSKHLKRILKYIDTHGSINANDYSKITTRARATRIQDFKKLVSMGLIKTIGQGKSTYYK